ncbi:ERMES complex subunit [Saccharomycopsis crataegensis]|uniref:Maintenance of mitochondrial morphology protein 1 n=1 Tax=Saccharomycopsis crataegensis TaxID=43959 RepID=A0AAV5QNJ1_9ASCO|nr:ERMES complex subunit [Saccharomycopsis crataegensis]
MDFFYSEGQDPSIEEILHSTSPYYNKDEDSNIIATEVANRKPTSPTSVIMDERTLLNLDEYLKRQLMASHDHSANNSSNVMNFTKGFILGQLSVIVVIIIFIRFFVFSESVPKNAAKGGKKSAILITNETIINGNGYVGGMSSGGAKKGGVSDNSKLVKKAPSNRKNSANLSNEDDDNEMAIIINSILEKTYYDVNTHQTESLDWFNVLVAQIITQFRTEALYENNIINSLNEFLSNAGEKNKIPDWLDTIKINEINIGDDFPIFSNCRIIKNKLGKLEAKIDVDLSDTLTLAIETKILVNKPKVLTAALPIKLSVSLVRFSGCLNISLDSVPEDCSKDINTSGSEMRPLHLGGVLNFGFSADYRLEFKTESLIGARSKLENVPKISYLIENQLKNWFVDRCVEPRFQSIPLPNMWPRKKNTRGKI